MSTRCTSVLRATSWVSTMSKRTTDDEKNLQPVRQRTDDPSPSLTAKIIDPHNRLAECTIFPRTATEAERMTTWITAEGDSFVDLEAMR